MSATTAGRYDAWKTGFRPRDRRPTREWAHDNIILPSGYAQPGRIDLSTSRHLWGPLAAFDDDQIREASWCGAVQTGKSLVIEIAIARALCEAPGPTMWTMQTDEDGTEHCSERFMPMLTAIPKIRAMLPDDRHKQTSSKIYFGPFFIVVNGANKNNLQRVSIRYKFNSECWLWKQGLLEQARGRVSAFEKAGNSKVLNESQGGTAGDDFHLRWDAGTQEVWSVRCFGCGAVSPLEFAARCVTEPAKHAGVIWDQGARREDGTWNLGRVAETVRWRCPHCGHEHDDTARTRARWNSEGEYVRGNAEAPRHIASFRWEALVAREMALLAVQFLEARQAQKMGLLEPMSNFMRQRRALPFSVEQTSDPVALRTSGYNLTDDNITAKLANETDRIMTIDRQRDHFWTVVRAWRADGSSRLLYRSRIETPEQLETIRQRFAVSEPLTFEDSGYFPDGAYGDCARFGWTALKGSGDNYFTIGDGAHRTKRAWSQVNNVLHDGRIIPLVHWASDPIKDILHNLRSGKGASWECADDAGAEYERQMNGDQKRETVHKKTGRSEWRWVRKHANHYWDCEAMQVAGALMLGILAAPSVADDKPDKPETAG